MKTRFIHANFAIYYWIRGVAQPGSASALGAEGRMFESSRPDQIFLPVAQLDRATAF